MHSNRCPSKSCNHLFLFTAVPKVIKIIGFVPVIPRENQPTEHKLLIFRGRSDLTASRYWPQVSFRESMNPLKLTSNSSISTRIFLGSKSTVLTRFSKCYRTSTLHQKQAQFRFSTKTKTPRNFIFLKMMQVLSTEQHACYASLSVCLFCFGDFFFLCFFLKKRKRIRGQQEKINIFAFFM